MITPDRALKLCDFGAASELNQFTMSDECTQSTGTPAFQSPQVATGEKQFSGFKLDIWAAGVTLFYLTTGTYPFEGDSVFELYEAIAKAEYKIPNFVEQDLKDLIRGMMDKEEATRFTIEDIKANKWFCTSQYADKEQPNLVDRWKSFSLSPFIASHVSTLPPNVDPYNDIRRMSLSVCTI
jgi:serine/threonine-protein kinase 11